MFFKKSACPKYHAKESLEDSDLSTEVDSITLSAGFRFYFKTLKKKKKE